ncbi:MAG: DUF350 domain-containing protein [Candidatus Micrarchaeota archaeon]
MMLQELLLLAVIILLRILAALALSAGTLYSGMRMLDSLTSGIDEWKEIQKGNAAIGILFVAVMASLILLVGPMIDGVVSTINPGMLAPVPIIIFVLSVFNFLIGLLAGVVVLFIAINLIDRITPDVEEFAELKKGNAAVALIFAAALLLVAVTARAPFESFFALLQTAESALL